MAARWLNTFGLSLQFLALFLLTPDIIGQERMKAASKATLAGFRTWLGDEDYPRRLKRAIALMGLVGIGIAYLEVNFIPHSDGIASQARFTAIVLPGPYVVLWLSLRLWRFLSKTKKQFLM